MQMKVTWERLSSFGKEKRQQNQESLVQKQAHRQKFWMNGKSSAKLFGGTSAPLWYFKSANTNNYPANSMDETTALSWRMNLKPF